MSKFCYAISPNQRFEWKHSVNGYRLTVDEAVCLDRSQWNVKIDAVLHYQPLPTDIKRYPDPLVGIKRFTIVLKDYPDLVKRYQRFGPSVNPGFVTVYKRNARFTSWNAAQFQGNNVALYPDRIDLVTAVWNDVTYDYDVYFVERQFIFLGHSSFFLPNHFDAHMISYHDEVSVYDDQVDASLFISKPRGEQEERFVWTQHIDAFMKSSKCLVPDHPNPTGSIPPAPQRYLVEPLKNLNPSPVKADNDKYEIEQLRHEFRWTHTCEALEIKINPNVSVLEQAKQLTYRAWDEKAVNMLGMKDYGVVKIRHVIFATLQSITTELNASVDCISTDHANWKWLVKEQTIITFVWDQNIEAYRIYIHSGYVAVEAEKGAHGNLTVPTKIVFIGCFKSPLPFQGQDERPELVRFIVEKFDDIWENWRTVTHYVHNST